MSESCNSRHFSWLIKSCLPNDTTTTAAPATTTTTQITSLPNDLLLEILTRVPTSSLPSLPSVCRRWFKLLLSPSFLHHRLHHNPPLHHSLLALSTTSSLHSATLHFNPHNPISWILQSLPQSSPSSPINTTHSRLSSIGPHIFIIGPTQLTRYDTWTQTLISCTQLLHPRKKFASAVISNKIYIAGGSTRTVDEYDPDKNSWRVVSNSPRVRYGCIGAAVDGVFYVIGGLKLGGGGGGGGLAMGREAHVYASSMDLFDVDGGAWLRSRALPGGGCVVAACSAMGCVYVLSNHAVELSFWRFDGRRRGGGGGFGEWSRIKSPPLTAGQLRVDSRVKFSCVGVDDKVVLVQVMGCIDDLLRRNGGGRSFKQSLVLIYNISSAEWSRGPDLPDVITRAACVDFYC